MRTGAAGGAHRAPSRRRGLLAVSVLAVLALVAGVGTLLLRDAGDAAPGSATPPAASSDAGVAGAGGLAGWIDAELPDDTTLGAPEGLRTALVDAGVPGRRLVAEDTGDLSVVTGDPPAGAVVVARVPGQDGTVGVLDPAPGEPSPEDVRRRQRLADAVLANPVADVTGRAADLLRTADIDARLLGLVAVLVTRLEVAVADLPLAPGQPPGGTPARRALFRSAGGEELEPGSQAAERVRVFLAAQQPPFAPDVVEVTGDGILVGFDYSSAPDAEVAAAVG